MRYLHILAVLFILPIGCSSSITAKSVKFYDSGKSRWVTRPVTCWKSEDGVLHKPSETIKPNQQATIFTDKENCESNER